MGGQAARFHDPGFAYGFFHTFNGLQAGGVGDAPRKVHVLLPRRYEDDPSIRYPVVYMNDGQTVFWDDGPYEGKTWDAAARMSALTPCDIEPVILVAIYPLNVGREYTHARWSDDPDAACCAVEGYAGYLAETLKPFIDAHYRTQPQRALALGAAHGGLAAFITAALHPQAFPQAAALSPSFWAGLDIDHVPSPAPLAGGALLGLVEAGLSASRPKLWIDWGLVRDGQAHNDEIEARVAARAEELRGLLTRDYGYIEGVDLFTYADPEGQHEEASWGARLGRVLAIFYPAGDAG
ncbi:esterase family protein [Myxococcota bacterium]|nr:esterase family protein [Myxococcota bacterium]MBU1898179.1 esterase family protein [Myxococcota bacterium]